MPARASDTTPRASACVCVRVCVPPAHLGGGRSRPLPAASGLDRNGCCAQPTRAACICRDRDRERCHSNESQQLPVLTCNMLHRCLSCMMQHVLCCNMCCAATCRSAATAFGVPIRVDRVDDDSVDGQCELQHLRLRPAGQVNPVQ
jgi:hypothetical protein